MIYVAGPIAAVLLLIGLIHMLWGLRVYWPAGDEKSMARAVVGATGIETMPPPYQCALVTLAMIVAAGDALLLATGQAQNVIPGWLALTVGCGCCLVFTLRGVVGFLPFWARLTPEEPFRTLDRRYYAPLCLLLGAGFAIMIWRYAAV